MQAVFFERKQHRNQNQEDQSKTYSKIITRKQYKRTPFNIKNKEEESPIKNKRSHSTHQFKFLKNTETSTTLQPNIQVESPTIKQYKRNNLVFNKFTRQEKQQIRQYLTIIHSIIDQANSNANISLNPNSNPNPNPNSNPSSNPNPNPYPQNILTQIEAYISKIQQNNSKLLQVNYFFQKQFNQIMAQKQISKRAQKCSKSNCMECRYHLQKQSYWKQQKANLLSEITKLKEEITSAQTSRQLQSKNDSIMLECFEPTQSQPDQVVIFKLRQQIQQKDEQYLILVKQFNYLDKLNKDLKNKLTSLTEQYKYLSIQNRTLLNTKAKLVQKSMECTKYKDQSDYFKKKIIDYHRTEEKRKNCQCNRQTQSIFSLSQASNSSNIDNIDNQAKIQQY